MKFVNIFSCIFAFIISYLQINNLRYVQPLAHCNFYVGLLVLLQNSFECHCLLDSNTRARQFRYRRTKCCRGATFGGELASFDKQPIRQIWSELVPESGWLSRVTARFGPLRPAGFGPLAGGPSRCRVGSPRGNRCEAMTAPMPPGPRVTWTHSARPATDAKLPPLPPPRRSVSVSVRCEFGHRLDSNRKPGSATERPRISVRPGFGPEPAVRLARKNPLRFLGLAPPSVRVICSVNPQVPGSSPGRGARTSS